MNDLISRQDAIDAIRASTSKYTGFMEMEMYTDDDAVEAIEALPSAEPVIHCKDCKHMIINEKHEAKPMICCFTKMCGTTEPDWFCADGERRTDE